MRAVELTNAGGQKFFLIGGNWMIQQGRDKKEAWLVNAEGSTRQLLEDKYADLLRIYDVTQNYNNRAPHSRMITQKDVQ